MRKFILTFVFTFFLIQGLAYADIISRELPKRKGLKAGEVIFHSALRTAVQYDSNIYLSPKYNAKDDIITIINPSVGFKIPFHGNDLSVEYDASFNRFYRFSSNSHLDHRIQSEANINLTDYKIYITDLYNHLTDRSGTEDVNRTKRQTNLFRTGVSTERDQLRFDLSYANALEQYLTEDAYFNNITYKDRSSMSHIIDFEGSYRFRPKTSLVWENLFGYVNYYRVPDSNLSPNAYYIESLLGIKGEWYSKITTDFRAGVRYQQFGHSNLVADDGYCNFEARGTVDYAFTPDDALNLRVEKSIYPSTYQDMNYYEVNMVGLNYSHKFYKTLVSMFGTYQFNGYPKESTETGVTGKRKDYLYSGGCAVKYDMRRWASLETKYEYKRRTSSFADFNYLEHLLTLTCTVGF
ncbi:MAG: outer membrane beta-barrel protein [Candidatus Omnitrophica bacterium]|nr:outer membrane beta-barrel protein [Candidatus Omnitrophota bacterium]